MTEGSSNNGRHSAGLVLKGILNGDRKGLLKRAQASRDDYLSKKQHLTETILTHISSLPESSRPMFFQTIALELFNDWAPNYSQDMYEHAKAAVGAIRSVAEDTITERVKNSGQIHVLDFAVGDGNILAYYLHLLHAQHPGLSINVSINDLSPEMTSLALNGSSRYDCLTSIHVKPLSSYNPTVRNVNIVSPNALNDLLSGRQVDVVFSSQVLDVIRGYTGKRKHIKDCHTALVPGGRAVVIGEDPSLFTLSGTLSIAAEVYFGLLFNSQGMGLQPTQHELEKISDRQPFHVIAQQTRKIENVHPTHSIFSLVAEKTSN